MQVPLANQVGEQISEFLLRWARLVREILSDLTSLGAPTQIALFVPFFYGFTLGFAVVDDWIERPVLWIPLSLSCGFAVTAAASLAVVLLSMQINCGGMEKMITYATVGLVSLPNVAIGARRERSRQRELKKSGRRLMTLIRRAGV